jgi:hypothetical protein
MSVETKKVMTTKEMYDFHQTPEDLCKKLINFVPIESNDVLFEPFAGEGSFLNNFPNDTTIFSTEIEQGKCFTTFNDPFDWVITNPPYNLVLNGKPIRSSFWYLLKYFTERATKGVALLANHLCFNSLSPSRIKELELKGWYLNNIIICDVKKWYGRYYFMIFSRVNTNNCIKYIEGIH